MALCERLATLVAPLLSTATEFPLDVTTALRLMPVKHCLAPLHSFQDGGGLGSKPDWSFPPPDVPNLFKPIRDSFFPILLQHDLHKRVVAHLTQKLEYPPIPPDVVQNLRDLLMEHLPDFSNVSWTVRDEQPFLSGSTFATQSDPA